jgi:hypothetical protein
MNWFASSFALGAIGAICGWVIVKFVAEPIRKFWDLRGDVAHALYERARFVAGTTETDMMFFMCERTISDFNAYSEPRAEAVAAFRA